MHTPSTSYVQLIDEAGGVLPAAAVHGIPASTLYCVRNGYRRIGRSLAERLETSTGGRYLAADLLGLTRKDEKAA